MVKTLQACIPKRFSPVRMERFRKNVLPEKLLVQRSHGISENKNIREKIEPLCTAAWKEKTPETSYREMNTNLRFAVERSLLQIDSYGQHVYDWTHRRIS